MMRASRSFAMLLVIAPISFASSSASAEEPEPLPPLAAPAPATTPTPVAASESARAPTGPARYDLIRANLGLRVGYVPSRGYDVYSTSDALPQWSLDATYPLLVRRKLVVGAGFGWDWSSSSASTRGLDAHMSMNRLYVPVEGRYHLLPGVALFGKVAPGAVTVNGTLKDPSAPAELTGRGWAFSADASAGAAILLGPRESFERREPRMWIAPEMGYSFTTSASISPGPDRDAKDALGNDESVRLRSIALSGFFWRATVGMTF